MGNTTCKASPGVQLALIATPPRSWPRPCQELCWCRDANTSMGPAPGARPAAGGTHTWEGDGPDRNAVNSSMKKTGLVSPAMLSGGALGPRWQEAAWLSPSVEALWCVVTTPRLSLGR